VASAGIAAFSTYLLAARFTLRRVPGFRSPAWMYFLGGFCLVVLNIAALVFGWQGASPSAVLFFTFMCGVIMFIAGMVSN
jgi:hypothetical protein